MAQPAPDKSRFIQDVTIRNFKCFEELKIEGCGQFNLILGDNNVGKTSVLEALLVDEDAVTTIEGLDDALDRRGLTVFGSDNKPALINPNLFDLFVTWKHDAPHFSVLFKYNASTGVKEAFLQNRAVVRLPAATRKAYQLAGGRGRQVLLHSSYQSGNEAGVFTAFDSDGLSTASSYDSKAHCYVPAQLDPDDMIAEKFSELTTGSTSSSRQFVSDMQTFIPEATSFDILLNEGREPYLAVRLDGIERARPLSVFGDGTRRLCQFLLEMPQAQNDRLMIDEIDAGIHYSRFATLWRTTLKAAIANNVQLFITTHNVECLRKLQEVLDTDPELKKYQDECRAFTLRKLPNGSVKAYRHSFDQFENALVKGYELRGGVL